MGWNPSPVLGEEASRSRRFFGLCRWAIVVSWRRPCTSTSSEFQVKLAFVLLSTHVGFKRITSLNLFRNSYWNREKNNFIISIQTPWIDISLSFSSSNDRKEYVLFRGARQWWYRGEVKKGGVLVAAASRSRFSVYYYFSVQVQHRK